MHNSVTPGAPKSEYFSGGVQQSLLTLAEATARPRTPGGGYFTQMDIAQLIRSTHSGTLR